jgi:hypothetical protein
MPKTIAYRPDLIDNLITNARLNSYKSTFNTTTDVELVGAYLWNINVCSELYHLISCAEIALRNAIDNALTNDLGYFWWRKTSLHYKSFAPTTPPPYFVQCVYDNFSAAAKAVKREKRDRYNITGNIIPTHQEVVAKTEFSTWEFLLDSEFMGNNLIWPKHLATVFSGTWPQPTPLGTLTYMRALVKATREFRNRIFHHEPAWKKFGITNEADAIAHLHQKIDKLVELLMIISPIKHELLEKNRLIQNARRACSIGEIRRFQDRGSIHNIKTLAKLRTAISSANSSNAITKIVVYTDKKNTLLLQPF